MKKLLFLILLLIPISKAAEETPDSWFIRQGVRFIRFMDTGQFLEATNLMEPAFDRKRVPLELQRTWNTHTKFHGPFKNIEKIECIPQGEVKAVRAALKFGEKAIGFHLLFSRRKNIRSFQFVDPDKIKQPTRPHRPYCRENKFRVEPFHFGNQKYPLKGELYLPVDVENPPIIIFTHDFGPQDIYHQIGIHRFFLDFAEGLASNGVGVLLFPKRSFIYDPPEKPNLINPHWEILEDLFLAVYTLKIRSNTRKSDLILAAYGFSAWFVPYFARNRMCQGYILLNPGMRHPLNILFETEEFFAAGKEDRTEDLFRIFNEIEDFFSGKLPPEKMIMGYPVSYFNALEPYAPMPLEKLKEPFLGLFAQKDFVQNPADIPVLEKVFQNVQFKKLYFEDLNRLFHIGRKLSPNEDYYTPGIVSPLVIGEILKWVKKR
jgi:hypothetical protein